MPLSAGLRTYWVVQEGYGPDDAVRIVLGKGVLVCDLLEKAAALFSFEDVGKLLPSQLQVYVRDNQLNNRSLLNDSVESSDTIIIRPKPGEVANTRQINARRDRDRMLRHARSTSPNRQVSKRQFPRPVKSAAFRTSSPNRSLANSMSTNATHVARSEPKHRFSSASHDRPVRKHHTLTHPPVSKYPRTPTRTPNGGRRNDIGTYTRPNPIISVGLYERGSSPPGCHGSPVGARRVKMKNL